MPSLCTNVLGVHSGAEGSAVSHFTLLVLLFPANSLKHGGRSVGYSNLPLGVKIICMVPCNEPTPHPVLFFFFFLNKLQCLDK